MPATRRKTLAEYLALDYPFDVKVDPEGGYAVLFPDLPGCYTEADTLEELPAMVAEARALWLETAYAQGIEIPLPSVPEECSGKILLRVPKSLHRRLLDQAAREDASLNHYISGILGRGDAQAAVEKRLETIELKLQMLTDRLEPYHVDIESSHEGQTLSASYSGAGRGLYAVAS